MILIEKLRLLGALLALGLVGMFGVEASAQDFKPVRVALINVAGKDGAQIAAKLLKQLEANEKVELVDASKVGARMKELDLTQRTLAKGSLREKNQPKLAELMQESRLEGLLLLDVYGRGKKAQVVMIGPSGRELADDETKLKRARQATDAQVLNMLRASFGPLVPVVNAHREEQARAQAALAQAQAETPRLEEAPSDEASGEAGEVTQTLEPGERPSTGHIRHRMALSAGVAMGQRTLALKQGDGPDDYSLDHSSPFIGGEARIEALPLVFGEDESNALGVSMFGAYAPFSTLTLDPVTGEEAPLSSAFARFGMEAMYVRALGSRVLIDLFAGFELMSVNIAPNDYYTGNRYVMGRGGLGVTGRLSDAFALRVHGSALPLLDANNSAGAFGESPRSLGYEAGARLSFDVLDDVFIQGHYQLQRLTPAYPDPNPPITAATTSQDVFHTGGLVIGLRL